MIHDPNVKGVCVQMCNCVVVVVVNVWLVLDAETTWFGNIKSVTRKIYIKE